MEYIKLYLIGVAVAFALITFWEWKFYVFGKLSRLSKREWKENTIISLFSWLAVALTILFILVNWIWPSTIFREDGKGRNAKLSRRSSFKEYREACIQDAQEWK